MLIIMASQNENIQKTKECQIRHLGSLKFPITVKYVEPMKFLGVLGKNIPPLITCTFTDTVQFVHRYHLCASLSCVSVKIWSGSITKL